LRSSGELREKGQNFTARIWIERRDCVASRIKTLGGRTLSQNQLMMIEH